MTSESHGIDLSIALSAVRIVLVAPAGPLNVGSVARVMKNFGLTQLVLVAPQCDPLGPEALKMAVHARDILSSARQVETLPEALSGCAWAIATTARTRGFNAPLELPEVAFSALLGEREAGSPERAVETALIFGPEDRGLSNQELAYAQRFVKIPTDPGYGALNLAQAVAVCCYELYLKALRAAAVPQAEQNLTNTLRNSPLSATQSPIDHSAGRQGPDQQLPAQVKQNSAKPEQAKLDELEGYYQHLESLLLEVGYLYPHTAASRMRKLRQLLHRASPTSNEVALLRGILRQVEWALSQTVPPDSAPSD